MTAFVGINLLYAVGDLSHPESPAPFISTTVVMVAGVVTLALAVLAAKRRPAAGRRVWTVTLAALGLAAVASLAAGAAVDDDTAQPGDTVVVAEDYEYPDVIEVASTGGVLVDNRDRGRHTFVVEGRDGVVEVPANSRVRLDLGLAPGTYRYFCDVAGHESMKGTLVVK